MAKDNKAVVDTGKVKRFNLTVKVEDDSDLSSTTHQSVSRVDVELRDPNQPGKTIRLMIEHHGDGRLRVTKYGATDNVLAIQPAYSNVIVIG